MDARIDLEDSTRRGWTVAAPSVLLPKDTACPVPAGPVLFAAPEGDSKAAASTYKAPTTLENAIKAAPAGATIILHGGTYCVGGLMLERRLTLQAAAHEQPWIKGSDVVTGWVRDGASWRHDSWKHAFPPPCSPTTSSCPARSRACCSKPRAAPRSPPRA